MYNKDFNLEQVKCIYKKGLELLASRDQWIRLKDWSAAATYEEQLRAIVELLENIVVFHIGDGIAGFSNPRGTHRGLDTRLKSFAKLFKKEKKSV
jgi:hypothetical protein